eukprot:g8446.t1
MDRWDYDDVYDDWYDDEDDDGDFPVQRPKPVASRSKSKSQTKQTVNNPPAKPRIKQEPNPRCSESHSDQSAKLAPLSEYQLETELAQYAFHTSFTLFCRLCQETSKLSTLPILHLVVLGHVDAGKSTLMGRLLHDLGVVSKREMHKYKREATEAGKGSFSWAWVLDERPEERARGITVDVATARFQTQNFSVNLLDAPGHKDFVPNMISGAAQADAALLVVDGSIGGFEAGFEEGVHCGQTREHAQLARSLGIEQIAIVVTKLDTCEFSEERFSAIQSAMTPFLELCGFKRDSIQWLMASAPNGLNMINAPIQESQLAWYSGPTVLQAIDHFHSITRSFNAPLRLPVGEVVKSRTLGTGVSGKIESGAIRVGSRVWISPLTESAIVKAIEIGGKSVDFAKAGDCCDIGLSQIDGQQLFIGCVLCPEGWPTPVAHSFEAKVLVLEAPVPILPGNLHQTLSLVVPGLQVSIQCHAVKESAKITRLVSLLNSKTSQIQKQRPRCLLKGQTAVIEVELSRGVCLEEYASFRALGRVAIRESGRTIAVGIVTKIAQTKEQNYVL